LLYLPAHFLKRHAVVCEQQHFAIVQHDRPEVHLGFADRQSTQGRVEKVGRKVQVCREGAY
jgi:hypothetical protein